MWNAASTSVPRATRSVVAGALVLVMLAIAATSGAAPKPPRDLQLTNATETSLSLAWGPARAHGERTISGYHVYLDAVRQTTAKGDDLVQDTSFEFTSLYCGTTYTVGVEAVDDSGATSDVGSVMASTGPCANAAPAPAPVSAAPTQAAPAPADTTDAGVASVAAAAPAAPSGAVMFDAVADARVDEALPDTNFGARNVLRVNGTGGSQRESYVRFDVSGLSGSVTSAKLRLYATAQTADGPAVSPTSSTWTESAITWANRPAAGSAAADVGPIAAGTWVEWDVTKLVTGNGSQSFVLASQSPDGVALSSREGGAAPQLVVSTDGSNPSGSGGGDTSPPSAPVGPTLVSHTSSDIAVSWGASTDNVGVAGYDLLLNGTKTGQTTSLTATFSGLACGQSYSVGVRAFDAAGNRSNTSSLATGTLACSGGGGGAGGGGTGSVNWFPGYYVISHAPRYNDSVMQDPLSKPFTGYVFRYFWSAGEQKPGDFSAGFTQLDSDLAKVAAQGKKLIVMLMYKRFDGVDAVPPDLVPGGEMKSSSTTIVSRLWDANVSSRFDAFVKAMVSHAMSGPHSDAVAAFLFNETALGTRDNTILSQAGYDAQRYMNGVQSALLAVTGTSSRVPAIYFHEGGFYNLSSQYQQMKDFMASHPHMGVGTPDMKPKDPKPLVWPGADPAYQGKFLSAPAVESADYSSTYTDSFDQTYHYGVDRAPNGLGASMLIFSHKSDPGPFSFADVSAAIASHPIPNTALPPGW